jgi:hypothetical protein
MHHPDFRVCGKIFAPFDIPTRFRRREINSRRTKRLGPRRSERFPSVKGAWGRRGSTSIHLPSAKIEIVREALGAAWRNTAPKRLTQTR